MVDSSAEAWKTLEAVHEGFPLLLRCPASIPYERQSDFPRLVALTLEFSKATQSGLPEADYNDGLTDFDVATVRLFRESDEGVTVLVETFAGKRHYYSYVDSHVDVDTVLNTHRERFPDVKLQWAVHENADWRFIRNYAAEYAI